MKHDIRYAYPNYEAICYPDVNRDDYVYNQLPGPYEFIQVAVHSLPTIHVFFIGDEATSDDIRAAHPQALFYNLYACSALCFTTFNCLGNAYILDTQSPSLAVVGSTKSGAMRNFSVFYKPLGQGVSFGSAFQQWFEFEYPYSDGPENDGYNDVSWFYGMTILGDPTLTPRSYPRPDLVISDFSVTSPSIKKTQNTVQLHSDTEILLTAVIKNNGTVDIRTPFTVTFYGASLTCASSMGSPLGTVIIPELEAGGTVETVLTCELPPNIRLLSVFADSGRVIEESNENNNWASITIHIG
jgi:hypothetical protein